jgi:hypothetical protein
MELPEYLTRWPGLSVREGDRLVPASEEDVEVARAYPQWPDKGPLHDGVRLTLLTRKTGGVVGETFRVLHVVEVTTPGREVYVMGPKPIVGEYVDGTLATAPVPEEGDPLAPADEYDGRVQPGPAVDYNYDITTYSFDTPGTHRVQWQMGPFRSNTLTFQIAPAPAPQ